MTFSKILLTVGYAIPMAFYCTSAFANQKTRKTVKGTTTHTSFSLRRTQIRLRSIRGANRTHPLLTYLATHRASPVDRVACTTSCGTGTRVAD